MAKLVVAGNVIGDLETVNGKSPDASGNVKLSGDDLLVHGSGTTASVGTAIDAVKTTADAAVKKVNGHSPDASGDATVIASQIGTSATGVTVQDALDGKVKSVNGTAPTSGNIALNGGNIPYAADSQNWTIKQEVDEITDKLPEWFVLSVNGESPDPDGDVFLDWTRLKDRDDVYLEEVIVKSVNGVLPDTSEGNDVVLMAENVPYEDGFSLKSALDAVWRLADSSVRSVNDIQPDGSGNLLLLWPDLKSSGSYGQKLSEALALKANLTDLPPVVQVEGASSTSVISQAAVSALLDEIRSSIVDLEFLPVEQLPATGQSNVVYLVGPDAAGDYDEYVWVAPESRFQQIGHTNIDLTPYLRIDALAAATGQSESTAMTQKATTDALGLKADKSQFQVVASLPATPDPNVWYVVTG
ncbi:MAG: hypothetical protein LBL55_11105 [Propionibacteriaceae bacterium]|nr:hypothetical protein [Propionibacteriaceae bacterium]